MIPIEVEEYTPKTLQHNSCHMIIDSAMQEQLEDEGYAAQKALAEEFRNPTHDAFGRVLPKQPAQ